VFSLRYELTPRNRVLPEKLTRPQLVKKFSSFSGNRRFVVASTITGHDLSLSWDKSINSMPPFPFLKEAL